MANRTFRRKVQKCSIKKAARLAKNPEWGEDVKRAINQFAKMQKTAIMILYGTQKIAQKKLTKTQSGEEPKENLKIQEKLTEAWLHYINKTVIDPLETDLRYKNSFAQLVSDAKASTIDDLKLCKEITIAQVFRNKSEPDFTRIIQIAVSAEIEKIAKDVLAKMDIETDQQVLDFGGAYITTPLMLIAPDEYPFIEGWIEDAKARGDMVPDLERLVLNRKVTEIVESRIAKTFRSLIGDFGCIRKAQNPKIDLQDIMEIAGPNEESEELAIAFYIELVRLLTKDVLMSKYSYRGIDREKNQGQKKTSHENADLIAQLKEQVTAAERATKKEAQEKIALKRSQKQQISELAEEAQSLRRQHEEDAQEILELKEQIRMLQTVEKEAEEEAETGKTSHIDPSLRYAVANQDSHFAKYIPQLRKFFPDLKEIARADELNPNHTDVVLILTQHIDHGFYWGIKGKCQASETPFLHINHKNPEMILKTVQEWVERKENGSCIHRR